MTQKLAIWHKGADHEESLKDNYVYSLFLDKVFGWNGSELFEIGAFFISRLMKFVHDLLICERKGWSRIFMWIFRVVKQLENNENHPL